METFSALLVICAGNSPVPGEFPAQRPVTRSFDVFFDLHPNKRLNKQWWGWWFETSSCPLWRHRNDTKILNSRWHQSYSRGWGEWDNFVDIFTSKSMHYFIRYFNENRADYICVSLCWVNRATKLMTQNGIYSVYISRSWEMTGYHKKHSYQATVLD